ncbi:MAG: histone deacetylase, partial [Chloroflexota bacterium]
MATAYITDTRFDAHTLAGHAEFAGRLATIRDLLNQYGLPARMLNLAPMEATLAQLQAVHTDEYLDLLKWTETQNGLQLGSDTYVLPESFGVAKLSAGAAIRGVDAVLSGEATNALVAARPP